MLWPSCLLFSLFLRIQQLCDILLPTTPIIKAIIRAILLPLPIINLQLVTIPLQVIKAPLLTPQPAQS